MDIVRKAIIALSGQRCETCIHYRGRIMETRSIAYKGQRLEFSANVSSESCSKFMNVPEERVCDQWTK